MFYLFIVLQLLIIYIFIKKNNLSLLNPIAVILYFYLLIYIISPFIISMRDFDTIDEVQFKLETPVELLLTKSLIMSTFYLSVFLLSIGKIKSINWSNKMPKKIDHKHSLRLFILVISIFFYVFLLLSNDFISNIKNLRNGSFDGGEFLSSLVHCTAFVASGVLPFILKLSKTKKSKLLGLVSVLLSYSLFLIIGDRSGLVYAILIFLIIYSSISSKKISSLRIIGYALFIFMILHFLTVLRDGILSNNAVNTDFIGQNSLMKTVYDSFNLIVYEYFILTLDLHSVFNYLYGSSFLNNFIGIIPRFMWPEKPIVSTAVYLSEKYYHDTSRGRPFTTLGEWYINFGWIGPLIGGFIFGKVIKLMYNKYYRNYKNIKTIILSTILLVIVLGNGIHSTVILQFLKFLLLSYLFLKFINIKS